MREEAVPADEAPSAEPGRSAGVTRWRTGVPLRLDRRGGSEDFDSSAEVDPPRTLADLLVAGVLAERVLRVMGLDRAFFSEREKMRE